MDIQITQEIINSSIDFRNKPVVLFGPIPDSICANCILAQAIQPHTNKQIRIMPIAWGDEETDYDLSLDKICAVYNFPGEVSRIAHAYDQRAFDTLKPTSFKLSAEVFVI